MPEWYLILWRKESFKGLKFSGLSQYYLSRAECCGDHTVQLHEFHVLASYA